MREIDFFRELNKSAIMTLENSVLIDEVTEDNIIKSINNKFVKIFKFIDINFYLQEMNKKREILNEYKKILNVLDTNVGLSIIIRNKRIDLSKKVLFDLNDNKWGDLKRAVNKTIRDNIDKDGNTYVLDKYFVFEIETRGINEARTSFEMVEHIFNAELERLEGAKLYELKRDNIYKFLAMYYNKNDYENKMFYKDLLKEEMRASLNISLKEFLRPKNMIINECEMLMSDRIYRGFYFYSNYKIIDVMALNEIMKNDFEVTTCIKLRKLQMQDAIREAELELGNADGEIYRIESELAKSGLSKDLLPRNAIQRKEEAVYINDSLKKRDENLFDISMYMMIDALDMKVLNERTYKLQKKCAMNGLSITIASNMQENIFNSILPNGVNQTPYIRTFDTESICAFNVFYAADCIMGGGDYYGVNILTGNPIVYDIMSGDNYNSLILGMSGKGKGYKAKETILYRVLSGKHRSTIIIDNENEYWKLTEALDGENIEITSGGKSHINLFDIDLSYGDNSISDKEDFILSVCAEMLHKPITSGQRTTISQAVLEVYEKWSNTNDKNDIPTIRDFTNSLRKIVDKDGSFEDKEILKAIEYYSDKSHCTLFRGKTNIDFNNKLITFNLSKLGKDLKTLAMEVICDTIWLKICKNRDAGIPTDLIIDEFHLMFKSSETASWMAKYWKQLRKYKGCPVGITQNPEDLLSSEDGRKVVANTNMNILLSMLEKDREIIKNTLNLTNEEIKYIRNKKAGEGILVIGAGKKLNNQTTIPFRNHYEKDNMVYALINTSDDAINKLNLTDRNNSKI